MAGAHGDLFAGSYYSCLALSSSPSHAIGYLNTVLTLNNLHIEQNLKPLFPPVTLTVQAREVVTLMGPSGCGKSTLLAAVVGDLAPAFRYTGQIELNGQQLDGLPMEQRHVGLLYQDDLLFPHMSVAENLLFALPAGLSRLEQQARIATALNEAGLDDYGSRDVASLSGGQRARISLLRTLLAEPHAVLLDEPFSKLDLQLRAQFRTWVFAELAQREVPVILVTHDPADCPGGRVYDLPSGVMTPC
ncbi:MAG: ATP-binding cassette domain-containing protein [Natronospirillum sp.]